MSSLEDRMSAPVLSDPNPSTEAALASIERKKLKQEAAGYAVMAMFAGFESATEGQGWFARLTRGARWFCIWFAMILPVYLFWSVVF